MEMVENNPGCSMGAISSDIRREYKINCHKIIHDMVDQGILKIRKSNQVYMVEN